MGNGKYRSTSQPVARSCVTPPPQALVTCSATASPTRILLVVAPVILPVSDSPPPSVPPTPSSLVGVAPPRQPEALTLTSLPPHPLIVSTTETDNSNSRMQGSASQMGR
jgi:hypothetical protein